MSMLGQTILMYLLVGVAVAVPVYLAQRAGSELARWLRLGMVVPFWPLFLPLLLTRERNYVPGLPPLLGHQDELGRTIGQVEAELDNALQSLQGWAEDVLERHQDRLRQLRDHWRSQALRIREMDKLLAETDPVTVLPADGIATTPLHPPIPGEDRLRLSRQARQQNLHRLREVRDESYADLLGRLAWAREVVSRLLLAKFSGASPGQAAEYLEQLYGTQPLSKPAE
jgi:hypothetical protein